MVKNLIFSLLMSIILISPTIAATRPEPIPLYGTYTRDLNRAKQTFNGKLNANNRPWKQTEEFSTICDSSGCVARTPNLYAPPGAPKFIEYKWVNNHWELKADHLFNCNDGSQVKSTITESVTAIGKGNFSGKRSIEIGGTGCPDQGPGVYQIPFKLIPQ